MKQSTLTRASNRQPCPVCHKPDWCLVAEDAAICMRVQSPKEYVFSNHAIGWIHNFKDPLPKFNPQPRHEGPKLNVQDFLTDCEGDLNRIPVGKLASDLGVAEHALKRLLCIWSRRHKAWAFPMRGGYGEYTGIRLRNNEGRKWAVVGSKEGVFYAFGNPNDKTLFVVEGPTDCAAGMSIGLDCVGRPSCYGGVDDVRIIVRTQNYKRVVIISDNDDVGRRGAKAMANAMFVPRCILTLPAKDMREFVNEGGRKPILDFMLNSMVWDTKRKSE